MKTVKALLALFLFALGACFVANGIGANVPLLRLRAFEGHDIPVGIVIMLIGLLVLRFWKIEETTRDIIETTRISPDGGSTTVREIKESTVKVDPAGPKMPGGPMQL